MFKYRKSNFLPGKALRIVEELYKLTWSKANSLFIQLYQVQLNKDHDEPNTSMATSHVTDPLYIQEWNHMLSSLKTSLFTLISKREECDTPNYPVRVACGVLYPNKCKSSKPIAESDIAFLWENQDSINSFILGMKLFLHQGLTTGIPLLVTMSSCDTANLV